MNGSLGNLFSDLVRENSLWLTERPGKPYARHMNIAVATVGRLATCTSKGRATAPRGRHCAGGAGAITEANYAVRGRTRKSPRATLALVRPLSRNLIRAILKLSGQQFVCERAGGRCEYCCPPEWICADRFTLDYILPLILFSLVNTTSRPHYKSAATHNRHLRSE
jgi:hypothetical protein